jgi:thiaminase
MNTTELLKKHADLWHRATHHRFLDGIRSGDLPQEAFDRWLVQDYRFVEAGLRAQCLLLAQAPRRDHALLAGGVAALTAELDWFEAHLRSRGVSLDVELLPTNRAYQDFLIVMAQAPYAPALMVAATAERAYFDAWTGTLPPAPQYEEFAARWTSDAFRDYVHALADATDRALAEASLLDQQKAEEAFVWTARYEAAFWEMVFQG